MKKLFLSILFAAFLITSPLHARLVESGLYTADLPGQWKFSSEDNITTFVSPENNCVFIITEGMSVDAHRKKVAPVVAQYAALVRARPEQNITVTRIYGVRVVVTILGDHPDRVPLYYSIKLKEEQAVPYR